MLDWAVTRAQPLVLDQLQEFPWSPSIPFCSTIPPGDWSVAAGVACAVTLGLFALKSILVHRLGKWAERTETKIDDVAVAALGATNLVVLLIFGLYVGSTLLKLAPGAHVFMTRAAITAGLVQVAIWADSGVRGWLGYYRDRREEDPARATSAAAVSFIVRVALWAVIALMILDNLGVNITTLVASLGIGGIAVALAVQNSYGAGPSIRACRPSSLYACSGAQP